MKIFLPLKKGTIERKTQTRVRFTLSLSPSLFLSGLFRSLSKSFAFLSGSKKKRKKKSNQISFRKSGDFSKNPTTFCFSRYYYYVELFSLSCAYTLKRGLEKREKTSAYKSNNNNNKRERKNSFDNTQNR